MAEMIGPSKYHRTLNGLALIQKREELGLTQEQLADVIEVSRQFISRLEGPGDDNYSHEVSTELAEKIEKVFLKNHG